MKQTWGPWILIAAGIFAMCGAFFDWDWFMTSRKAWLWVRMFGRKGARIFYGILGFGLVLLGVLLLLGVIK